MSIKNNFLKWTLLFILTININTMNAQNNINANQSLNPQQRSIVSITALTAVGNIEHLKTQLNAGLDAGLTINEIKEVLVQLYAYCGFPRSLNGINTFMSVVEEKKSQRCNRCCGQRGFHHFRQCKQIRDRQENSANAYRTGRKGVPKPELMPLRQSLILF